MKDRTVRQEIVALRKVRTELKALLSDDESKASMNRLKKFLKPSAAGLDFGSYRKTVQQSIQVIHRYWQANEWGSAEYEVKRLLLFINGVVEEAQTLINDPPSVFTDSNRDGFKNLSLL